MSSRRSKRWTMEITKTQNTISALNERTFPSDIDYLFATPVFYLHRLTPTVLVTFMKHSLLSLQILNTDFSDADVSEIPYITKNDNY